MLNVAVKNYLRMLDEIFFRLLPTCSAAPCAASAAMPTFSTKL